MYPRISILVILALLVFITFSLAENLIEKRRKVKVKNVFAKVKVNLNNKAEELGEKYLQKKLYGNLPSIFPSRNFIDSDDNEEKFIRRSYFRDDAETIEPMAYVHIQSSYPPQEYNRKCGRCVVVYKPCPRKPVNYPKPPRILLPAHHPKWKINKYGE